MIYTLPYQSEALLKSSYYKLRNILNPKTDALHLSIAHSHLQDLSNEDLYKKLLRLEGLYRTEKSAWTTDAIKIRIVNQL